MLERIAFFLIGVIVVMSGCGRSETNSNKTGQAGAQTQPQTAPSQTAVQTPPQSTPGQSSAQAQAAASTRPAQPAAAHQGPGAVNGATPVR